MLTIKYQSKKNESINEQLWTAEKCDKKLSTGLDNKTKHARGPVLRPRRPARVPTSSPAREIEYHESYLIKYLTVHLQNLGQYSTYYTNKLQKILFKSERAFDLYVYSNFYRDFSLN